MTRATQPLSKTLAWRVAGLCAGIAALGCVGCRLPCYDGPSAKNVLASRQLTQHGMREMERGDWKGAEKHFASAIKQCPGDHEAHRLYAETLWKAGQHEPALIEMSEALRLAGDDEQVLVRYAQMRLERAEFDQALDAAQRALDVNPHSADAWAVRGKMWQSRGDFHRAAADFHHALGCDAHRRDALTGLAQIYRLQNEPQRALANLRALADTYPADDIPRELLEQQAQALLALHRPGDAAEQFVKACRQGAPSLPLWLATANCQLRAGEPQSARTTLDQALAFWPDATEIRSFEASLSGGGQMLLTSRP